MSLGLHYCFTLRRAAADHVFVDWPCCPVASELQAACHPPHETLSRPRASVYRHGLIDQRCPSTSYTYWIFLELGAGQPDSHKIPHEGPACTEYSVCLPTCFSYTPVSCRGCFLSQASLCPCSTASNASLEGGVHSFICDVQSSARGRPRPALLALFLSLPL